VAQTLLRKGRQTLAELLRALNAGSGAAGGRLRLTTSRPPTSLSSVAGMSAAQLKTVLLVLIQQNLVVTWLQPAEKLVTGVRPAVSLYEADLAQMLQLIRCSVCVCGVWCVCVWCVCVCVRVCVCVCVCQRLCGAAASGQL
jgi:hypothetical protein